MISPQLINISLRLTVSFNHMESFKYIKPHYIINIINIHYENQF